MILKKCDLNTYRKNKRLGPHRDGALEDISNKRTSNNFKK